MKFRSKKNRSRLLKARQAKSASKPRAKAPIFEKLEERQLLSGAMYVGTNLDGIITLNSVPGDVSETAASAPFNDLIKHTNLHTLNTGDASNVSFLSEGGTYTISANGVGVVSLRGKQNSDFALVGDGGTNRKTFNFGNGSGSSHTFTVTSNGTIGRGNLAYLTIDSGTSLSNLKIIKNGATGTFNSDFKDAIQPFSSLRFMDWGRTNNNKVTNDSQRPRTNDVYGTGYLNAGDPVSRSIKAGVAYEAMVELANQNGQSAWFTIPVEVDDNYVTQMATYIKNNLNQNLKVFVEYGNETWNGQFSANAYIVAQGEAKPWGTTGGDAGDQWVAHRSAQIWKIFDSVLDSNGSNPSQSTNRLVKVLGSWSNRIQTSENRVAALKNAQINPDQIMPDALAIAPYFTPSDLVSRHVTGTTADNVALTAEFQGMSPTARVNRLLSDASNEMASHLNSGIDGHKAIADANDLWLVAYEGGQHMAATGITHNWVQLHAEDIPELVDALIAANRNSQMYNLYTTYLNTLRDKGIALYENFTAIGAPGKFGTWGTLEYQNQPLSQAHKQRAINNWINANSPGSINLAPIARAVGGDHRTAVAGNNGQATIKLDGTVSSDLDGTLSTYRWERGGQFVSSQAIINQTLAVGSHTYSLKVTDNQGKVDTFTVDVDVAPQGANGTLAQSNFTGSNATFQNDAGIDSVAITHGSLVQRKANNNGVVFRTTNDGSTPTSFSANKYLAFTVNPKTGETADFRGAKFNFTIHRTSFHSQRQFVLKSSADGFNQTIGGPTLPFNLHGSTGIQDFEFTIPASSAYQTGNPLEFRLYAYGSSYGHDTTLKALTIHGTTGSTPDTGGGNVDIVSNFGGNSAGGWSLGAGATNVVHSGGLRFHGHHSGNVPGESNNQLLSSKTRVRNENIYAGRTIAAGNDLRGATLEFTMQRHNWNSPRRFFVTANGQEVYNSSSYTGQGSQTFTATLGQQSVLSGSSAIDFRVYAYEGLWYGHSTMTAFSLQGGSTGGTNQAPNAVASDVSRTGAGNVTLNGSASSDPDGDSLTYVWKNSSGSTIGTTANVTTSIAVGSHQFTLTVSDGSLSNSRTITATATSTGGGNVDIVSNFGGNNAGGWSLGSGASNVTSSGGLRFHGHHSGNVPGESNNQLLSSKTRVRNENIYAGRTIAAGNDLRGATLEFTMQRFDWNSPRRFFVTANGQEVYNSSSYTGVGSQTFTATLGQQSVLSGSSSIDFRVYAYEGLWYGHSKMTAFSLQGGSTTGGTTPVNITSNFSGSNTGGWSYGAGLASTAIDNGLGFVAPSSSPYSTQQVGSTFTHARNSNHYIKRTISSSGTMDLRGASLNFGIQRTAWNSPHSYVVEIHGAGIGSNGIRLAAQNIGNVYNQNNFSLTLPTNSQLQTAGNLEFRIYAYDGLWNGSSTTTILRAFSLNSV